jgi:uncharacterized protein
MWIKRDFFNNLEPLSQGSHPIKVLTGPRQVGKTTLLERLRGYKLVLFDDLQTRIRAQENPALFLDQFQNSPLILDEVTLAPNLFSEIKKRVDAERRLSLKGKATDKIDMWMTGSNQTLLAKGVQESLAGRASYFKLNTLSAHEIGLFHLPDLLLKGGWPGLYANSNISPVSYLNNLISTFIERDIVLAAGIERKAAFSKMLSLVAGQVGQLFNASKIGASVGVETTTVQSWLNIIEQNGLVRRLQPYFNNINKRLIKTPKIYFEDTGLAVRLQGWSDYGPLANSPYYGHLVENVALAEITRFFTNHGQGPKVFFVRSKEKVEIDFLVELPNQKFVAIEVKNQPQDLSQQQIKLLESLKINIIEAWVLVPCGEGSYGERKIVQIKDVYANLHRVLNL